MSTFSDRLTTLREAHNFSKTKVASLVGVSLSRYANWEYGYNDPDMATLTKLATVLDTTTDYLTGRTNNPSQLTKNEDNEEKITQADLDSPVLSLDGTPITGKEAEDIREFARFKLLQKHKEENK